MEYSQQKAVLDKSTAFILWIFTKKIFYFFVITPIELDKTVLYNTNIEERELCP